MSKQKGTQRPILKEEISGLGARVKLLIGERSNSEYARKLGMSEGTVRNLLDGKLPRLGNLISVAKESGVSLDWLVFGKPNFDDESIASASSINEGGATYGGRALAQGRDAVNIPQTTAYSIINTMIELGLYRKEWRNAGVYFVDIYNAVMAKGGGDNSTNIERAVLSYLVDIYQQQVEHLALQQGDDFDAVKHEINKQLNEAKKRLEKL